MPRMSSLFWRGLFENMGTTLKFSSSFHPQTDGQSEEANSTDLDLLKCYVSEHKAKWEQYLPLVEYAYNNTVHSSIGKEPFEIVEGGKKFPSILHTKDKIFEADIYIQDMDEMYKKARLKKMKGKERLFPKLSMRYYGPFQVCDKISHVAYRLKLLEKWKIYNAFHVSLLKPFVGDVLENIRAEEQPEIEELDEILIPEQVQWRALDEINAGVCEGMTYEEIKINMPEEYKARKLDKLRYRYPRGESYLDVIQRLEPVIIELERQRAPVVVIAHQAILRALYAYFADKPLKEIPHIEVPLHTIIEIQMGVTGVQEKRYKLMDTSS
ncbi:hypothetical protein L7F22_029579 [Adiantum nelumboides]|nr:hypothetical protein [Adiantum nelumboides]